MVTSSNHGYAMATTMILIINILTCSYIILFDIIIIYVDFNQNHLKSYV
jgi:hypothetical protein